MSKKDISVAGVLTRKRVKSNWQTITSSLLTSSDRSSAGTQPPPSATSTSRMSWNMRRNASGLHDAADSITRAPSSSTMSCSVYSRSASDPPHWPSSSSSWRLDASTGGSDAFAAMYRQHDDTDDKNFGWTCHSNIHTHTHNWTLFCHYSKTFKMFSGLTQIVNGCTFLVPAYTTTTVLQPLFSVNKGFHYTGQPATVTYIHTTSFSSAVIPRRSKMKTQVSWYKKPKTILLSC